MITTAAHDSIQRPAGPSSPRAALALGLALAAAALLGTACGTTANTPEAAASPTTTAVAPSTTAVVVPSTTAVSADTRPTATIDQSVGAQGSRVHIRCVGEGDTTVVLINGFGGDTSGWFKVEPAISTEARVCSYDQPGTGTSDPPSATATFGTKARDLHALLGTIGEPGPYLAVGHSFGGAVAITFASLYADEVTGVVLIDASPANWPAAFCAVPDDGSDGAAFVQATCTGVFDAAGNSERLDVAAAFAEVGRIRSLGSLPLSVITAVTRQLHPGLDDSAVARLTDEWNRGQQDWAALSTDSHLVPVDDTSHHIEIDQPAVVIDEITRLLP